MRVLRAVFVCVFAFALIQMAPAICGADEPREAAARKWINAKAYAIPKWTAPEGEGYFSIIEGHNGRLYIGTHANGVNSWLVEFDPAKEHFEIVVDAHEAIGTDLKGFGSQAKIHTRNNVGKSGKIYFGTKQGYPEKNETREDYPGGYPMVYDPATGETKVYPIPVPHQGINSITPDESRGVAYVSTCADHRPGPGENAVFLQLDLKTGKYKELMDTEHFYGFIVVDYKGRAYHPILGGDIARYDADAGKLERLKQTIDGKKPTDETHLALMPKPDPINWDISPDRKTLYSQPMRANYLFAYDLTADGKKLAGRTVGSLIPDGEATDCRAMCAGPTGTVWCAITAKAKGYRELHLVSYKPGDASPRDHGPVAISNPKYTEFVDENGKTLPAHGGTITLADGTMTTRHVILGVCQASSGDVYVLALQPYTLLRIPAAALK